MLRWLPWCTVVVTLAFAGPSAQGEEPADIRTLRIRKSPATGVARFITPADGQAVRVPLPPGQAAPEPRDFFAAHGQVFGLSNADQELKLDKVQRDALGHTHTSYRQVYKGVPVFAAVIRVHQDVAGTIRTVNGTFIPNISVDLTPRLSDLEARQAALAAASAHHGAGPILKVISSRLVIFRANLARGVPGANHLAYEVEVSDGAAIRDLFFIDAHQGGVIDRIPTVCDLDRRVYDGGVDLPFLVWMEGDATPYGDPDIDNLIDFSGHTFRLYANATEGAYLSFDGLDGTMHAAVNNVGSCPNANWNGFSTNFCAGVTPDDVVAHEWTHAYTQYTSGLIYQWQAGALNESYSDIFGEIVDLINAAGTDAPGPARASGECSSFGSAIPPDFTINAPGAIAGPMTVGGAQFNPDPPLSVTANVQYVDDGDDEGGAGTTTDGCQPFVGFTAGRIALIDRGACPFTAKVTNAEAAGAAGVIIVNNQGDDVISMSGGTSPAIPSVMIGQSDGDLLKANLTGLNATITLAAGVDPSYRWLTGEDSPAFGGAIRDMWNPPCFGDPGKVTDSQYFCSTSDNGGVHTNSGIPNHAFSLIVDGGNYNGFTVSALGLTKAFHIYWRAQSVYQVPTTEFADHADALEQSCTDLLGINLEGLSTTSTPAGPSGQIITAADCAEVADAIDAVELRTAPDQCGFTALLDPDAPPPCSQTTVSLMSQNWESGMGAWIAGTRDVANPLTFDTPDWAVVSDLPDNRPGSGAFVADLVVGNCDDDLETGVLFLESPPVVIPSGVANPRLALEHWLATEQNFDGGNVKIDVNNAGFNLVPSSAFTFNPYSSSLSPMPENDNPMAGEAAFTGTNPGSVSGSWGQSQIDLAGLVLPGDTVRIRFEMGLDGCNGVLGWYIDEVLLIDCVSCLDSDSDGYGSPGSASCPLGSAEDCDNADPDVHPGAPEIADDGIDQDCSGADTVSCFADLDEDGFGSATVVLAADGDCLDAGESTLDTDCDDGDPDAYPGAVEIADDGIDQDCSGADTVSCFADLDEDGFGSATVVLAADGDCLDAGESILDTDCDDADPSSYPGAVEIADDGIDQDCSAADTVSCFEDQDGDGFGSAVVVLAVDGECLDPGESELGADCDDADPNNYPGNAEVCDGLDNNCDLVADNAPECCPGGSLGTCADLDQDNIRDDNCVWWACDQGACASLDVAFADVGGQFGVCLPDGTADGNDKFHALNCFANTSTLGSPPYPCESASPAAFNVDAGGQFGRCCPDGVCDGNDAFHALNAFAGINQCSCPPNFVCPCPVPTEPPQNPVLCPAGPAPVFSLDGSGPRVVGTAEIRLAALQSAVQPGGLIEVAVFLENSLTDLRGYQLHVAAAGGKRGRLELVDAAIEPRKEHVFAGYADWRAFNAATAQMVSGLDAAGIVTRPQAYLATFMYRASDDAAGTFIVDLLHDELDPGQRTFLFPTPAGAGIALSTKPAVIVVQAPGDRIRSTVQGR